MKRRPSPQVHPLIRWLQNQPRAPLLLLRCRDRDLLHDCIRSVTNRELVIGDLTLQAIDQQLAGDEVAIPKLQTALYVKDARLSGFHTIVIYRPEELRSYARWKLFEQALLQQAQPYQLLLFFPEQIDQWSAWAEETTVRLPVYSWSYWPTHQKEPQAILFKRQDS